MPEQLEQTLSPTPVAVPPATDAEILTYVRRSARFAEIAALTEQSAIVLANCEKLGITVSDEEWQVAGDAFRQEHKLWGTTETFAWLDKQRISVEEWSEGIRVALLEKKLKEHLFGRAIDNAYLNNRDSYRRVALSQILVIDLETAGEILQLVKEENASFCVLALEHSKGKQSQQNGGFVGIRFLLELMPEIVEAITNAREGEIIGPVQTKLGYHVFRVEKWFPIEFKQEHREQIMDSMFQVWIQNVRNFNQQ